MMPPVVPPIKCQGIKTKLAGEIKRLAQVQEFDRWVEPFCGSCVVALNVQPKRACHPMTACTARCQEQRPERRSNDGQTILRYIQMWPTPTSCPDH
jgi:DNA adenine methylase